MIFLILTCGNQWFLDSKNLAFWTKHDSCHGRSTICCGNPFGLATCCWSNGLWSLNATELRCRSTSKRRWIVRSAWHGSYGSGRGSIAFGYFLKPKQHLKRVSMGIPFSSQLIMGPTHMFYLFLQSWLWLDPTSLATHSAGHAGQHPSCISWSYNLCRQSVTYNGAYRKEETASWNLAGDRNASLPVCSSPWQPVEACMLSHMDPHGEHMVNTWWTLARHFQTQIFPSERFGSKQIQKNLSETRTTGASGMTEKPAMTNHDEPM